MPASNGNGLSAQLPALFCGGPAVGWSNWFSSTTSFPAGFLPWPQLAHRKVCGTFRGRTAIALACKLLGIGPGDEVLVPAYNCGSEIDALLQSGTSISAYQISRAGAIDLEDLKSRKTSRTKAVYVIHYFGWEQPLQELRSWCTGEGLSLIEDCALALFSCPAGALGRMGDAAIYSLPKTLGFYHGGLLALPAARMVQLPALRPAGFPILLKEMRRSLHGAISSGLDAGGLYGSLLTVRRRLRGTPHETGTAEEFPDMPSGYRFNPAFDASRAIHPRVLAVAQSVSWEEVVRLRRLNYQRLAGALAEIPGITPLFPCLPEGVCPLSLPLLVSRRDECVQALQARGIGALPWWAGFHRRSIEWSQFPDACWLKRHLLTLPVHQGLDFRHLDYLAEAVGQALRSD